MRPGRKGLAPLPPLSANGRWHQMGPRSSRHAGNYLSFANYMMRAKAEHMAAGGTDGTWSYELDVAGKHASGQSTATPGGAARQSCRLMSSGVRTCSSETNLSDPGGVAVAGVFFLLREIEISAARVGHVTFAPDGVSASWLLPSSKTDVRAVGATREWDCCCSIPGLGRPAP